MVNHQREQDIETFVVTVTNTSYQPGLQIMASNFAHIYHMGQQVQIGQPTLTEGVCWSKYEVIADLSYFCSFLFICIVVIVKDKLLRKIN